MSTHMFKAEQKINKYIENGFLEIEKKWPAVVDEASEALSKDIVVLIEECSSTYSKEVVAGAFKKALCMTHRYAQSEFWTIMLQVIKEHGEDKDNRNFDPEGGRNTWVKEMCQRVSLAAEDPTTLQLLKDDRAKRYAF